jgi:hypothetical protein
VALQMPVEYMLYNLTPLLLNLTSTAVLLTHIHCSKQLHIKTLA